MIAYSPSLHRDVELHFPCSAHSDYYILGPVPQKVGDETLIVVNGRPPARRVRLCQVNSFYCRTWLVET